MDPVLILIITVIGLAVSSLLWFLVKNTSKKKYEAKDGTKFTSQMDCDEYELLLEKLNCLYAEGNEKTRDLLGLDPEFINALRFKGFGELKTLIKYKNEFDKLLRLLEGK